MFLIALGFGSKAQKVYFDTVNIYFDIGKSQLLPTAKSTLDSLLGNLQETGDLILIYGYADYLGTGLPNQTLSDRRAEKVKQYLLNKGLPQGQIIQSDGVGQVSIRGREAHGNQHYRKAAVFIRRKKIPEKIIKQDLKLQRLVDKVEVGHSFRLPNINFIVNSSRYTAGSEEILEELLQVMKQNPELKIKLEGHVCCIQKGSEDAFDVVYHDFNLSRNRARRIYFYLSKNGIDKSRVEYEGFGKSRPMIDPEMTEEDKEKNRRVEVRILEK